MEIFSVPLVTVLRPCGNGTSPLDQTTVGFGKPNTRQEREATEFPITFTTLSGVSRNCGGTGKKTNKQVKKPIKKQTNKQTNKHTNFN